MCGLGKAKQVQEECSIVDPAVRTFTLSSLGHALGSFPSGAGFECGSHATGARPDSVTHFTNCEEHTACAETYPWHWCLTNCPAGGQPGQAVLVQVHVWTHSARCIHCCNVHSSEFHLRCLTAQAPPRTSDGCSLGRPAPGHPLCSGLHLAPHQQQVISGWVQRQKAAPSEALPFSDTLDMGGRRAPPACHASATLPISICVHQRRSLATPSIAAAVRTQQQETPFPRTSWRAAAQIGCLDRAQPSISTPFLIAQVSSRCPPVWPDQRSAPSPAAADRRTRAEHQHQGGSCGADGGA